MNENKLIKDYGDVAHQLSQKCVGDPRKRIFWLKRAADHGHLVAQNNLATFYENGDGGVDRDIKAAVELYRSAATKGEPTAQYNLGRLYLEGKGVRQDTVQALCWLNSAGHMDNVAAQCLMGDLYISNNYEGVVRSEEISALWYERAAGHFHPRACFLTGKNYWHGKGVHRNMFKAFEWFTRAAYKNYKPAMKYLADCYLDGKGTFLDPKEAVFWYLNYIRHNMDQAWGVRDVVLHWMERGSFMPKNPALAYHLWKQQTALQHRHQAERIKNTSNKFVKRNMTLLMLHMEDQEELDPLMDRHVFFKIQDLLWF